MAATIGIKIANGEFYSILNENSSVKKRLILTTVHNNQSSVQIDLYKSDTKTMADALYIGSLVVEKIKPRPKGTPSIELIISSGQDGTINADALDLDTTNNSGHQYLNVSLQSLDDDSRDYDMPDFEMEDEVPPPVGLYEKAKAINESKKRRSPLLVILCAVLVLIAAALCIWYFFFKDSYPLSRFIPAFAAESPALTQNPAPQPAQPQASTPQQAAPEPVVQPEPVPQPEPQPVEPPAAPAPEVSAAPPVIEAPVQAPAPAAAAPVRTRPAPPVASYNVPATIPPEGVPYRIRYGDTLWDIAEAFYRNPWLYTRIARFNNIRNPDRIISGTTIRIPPRN